MITEDRQPLVYKAARVLKNTYGIKLSEALVIASIQFKFVRHVMSKNELEGVLLPGFGSFEVNHNRVKKVSNKRITEITHGNLLKKKKK